MLRRKSTLSWARKHLVPSLPSLRQILDMPMLQEIATTIDDTPARTFLIMAPVQVFKSLFLELRAARGLQVEPADVYWYFKTEQQAKDFSNEKFGPLLDSAPVLKGIIATDAKALTTLRTRVPSGHHTTMLSANVTLNRNSRSAQEILYDETWDFEDEWLPQISNRRSSASYAWRYREIHATTGAAADHPVNSRLWKNSDQRERHLRCPVCEKLFRPRFGSPDDIPKLGGVFYDSKSKEYRHEDGTLNEPFIRESARYHCPNCHTEHRWTPALAEQMDRGGEYVSMNPHPDPEFIAWHVHGVCCKPWGELAVKFARALDARARGDLSLLEDFIKTQCAEAWNPFDHQKTEKLKPIGTIPYKMGEDWKEGGKDAQGRPWKLAAVDVQQDYFVLVIRWWNAKSQSRLVWAEKVTTVGLIADLCKAHGVLAHRVFLDARHQPEYVHKYCGQFGWSSVLGDPEKSYLHGFDKIRRIYSEPRPLDPFLGTAQQGRSTIYEFHFSKPSGLDRLHLLRTLETNDGEPLWTAAVDAPKWYFFEVDSPFRVRMQKPDGTVYYQWQAPHADHSADCEVIQVIGATMAGLTGMETTNRIEEAEEKK